MSGIEPCIKPIAEPDVQKIIGFTRNAVKLGLVRVDANEGHSGRQASINSGLRVFKNNTVRRVYLQELSRFEVNFGIRFAALNLVTVKGHRKIGT